MSVKMNKTIKLLILILGFLLVLSSCSAVRTGGTKTRESGEKLEKMGKEREGTLVGDSLELGGSINKAVGAMIEETVDSVGMKPNEQSDNGRGKAVRLSKNVSTVNIRPTPSVDGTPVASLKGGTKVFMLEEKGDWLRVRLHDDRTGWVYKYLVQGYQ
jgi:uncharacterized protein YgiM (DUF1202 family)